MMDALINTLDNRKIAARVVGVARTRIGTRILDVPGMTSHGKQVWGSRTIAKADKNWPSRCPVWIKAPRSQCMGTVLGVAGTWSP